MLNVCEKDSSRLLLGKRLRGLVRVLSVLALSALAACGGARKFFEQTPGTSALAPNQSTYSFGQILLGFTSPAQTVTLTNLSSQTVYVQSFAAGTSNFTVSNVDCGATIASHGSCNLSVTFSPTGVGAVNDTLTVIYNLGPGTNDLTLEAGLTGVGISALTFAGIETLSQVSGTSALATWTPIQGALSYRVYEVNPDQSLTLRGTALPTDSSFVITGISAGITHFYRVQAVDALGNDDGNTNDLSILIPAGGPAQLALTGPTPIGRSSCRAYAVTLRDVNGNVVNATSGVTVNLSGAGSGNFYGDSLCQVITTSVVISVGNSSQTLYFSDPVAESVTLAASATGLTSSTLPVTVTNNPPAKLGISGPASATVNNCVGYAARVQDTFGNDVNVASAVTVSLSGAGNGQFYSDAGCTTTTTQVTVAVGAASQAYFFKDTMTESLTFNASAAGLTSATLGVTIISGNPVALSITGPQSISTGTCIGYVVHAKDSFGNDAPVVANTSVSLTGDGNGSFYSDASCTNALSTATLTSGSATQAVFFSDGTAENLTFDVSATGLTSGQLAVTVNAGAASRLVVTGPGSIASGVCSSYTVTHADVNGNGTPASSSVIVNLGGVGAGSFYSDSSCTNAATQTTVAAGTTNSVVYFRDNTAENLSLSASATGLATGTLAVTVTSGSATKLAMSGPPTVSTGACSAYVVNLQDTNSNNTPATGNVTVTIGNSGSGVFYSDAGCIVSTSSFDITVGQSNGTIYFKDNIIENINLSANATGLTAATLPVSVQSGTPTKLGLSGLFSVGANSCVPYTVTSLDAANIPANVTSATPITIGASGNALLYLDAACSTTTTSVVIGAGSSSTTFFFRDTLPESVTINASATGLTGTSLSLTVTPGNATKIIFQGPAAITAGVCSGYTVTAQDANSLATNVNVDTVVSFSAGGAAAQFYSDAACSTNVSSTVILNGSSSSSFFVRDNTAEAVNMSGTSPGLTTATLPVTVSPDVAQALQLNGPQTVTTGACTAYTIRTMDQFGNFSSVTGATTINLGGVGSGSFFSDGGCTTPATTTIVGSGTSTQTVYYEAALPQSVTLSVGTAGFTPSTLAVNVVSGSPVRLGLTGPTTINASNCASYTVVTQDGSGNQTNATSNTTITMSGAGSGTFFSDATCSTPSSSVNILSGTSSANIYFLDTTVENLTFTASATGLLSSSLSVSVQAATAARLALNGSITIPAASCNAYTIETQDTAGNPSNVASNTTINLSQSGVAAFYSDSGCLTTTTSAVVNAGTSSRIVYLKDNAIESITLTVTATGLTGTSLNVNVIAGAPTQLALNGATSINAGACSTFSVTTRDSVGNSANVASNTSVGLTNSGSGIFYSDSACTAVVSAITVPAGSSQAIFYFIDGIAESTQLTAQATGFVAANLAVQVLSGNPTRLSITGPSNITTGGCTPYIIDTQNSIGGAANVTSDTTINLSGQSAGSYYSDAGCISSTNSVVITTGTSTRAVYFKDNIAESILLAANATGLTGATKPVTVAPGTPTRLAVAGPINITASVCSTYTVTVQDANGNAANVASNTTVNLANSGTGVFYSDNGCSTLITAVTVNSGTNNSTYYFRDTVAEQTTMNLTSTGLTSTSLVIDVAPAAPTRLSLAGALSITAGSCTPYTLSALDNAGNNSNVAANTTVNLAGQASGAFYSNIGCTSVITQTQLTAGTSTTTIYFADNIPETTLLTASSAGLTQAQLAIQILSGTPARLALNGATSLTSGTCSPYSVHIQDNNGNPSIVGSDTTVNLTVGGSAGLFSDAGCSIAASTAVVTTGTSTASFYFRDNVAESVTVNATSTGLVGASINITIGPATPSQLALTGLSTILADGCFAYDVHVQDSNGNPAPGGAVLVSLTTAGAGIFYSDAACSTSVTQTTIGAGNSQNTFYFKDSVAQATSITASSTGLTPANFLIQVDAGSTTKLALNGATTLTTGSCGLYTVTAQDSGSNPVTQTSTLTVGLANNGAGQFFSDAACSASISTVNINIGTNANTFYFRDNSVETLLMTASSAGLTDGTLTVTTISGSPTRLALSGPGTVGTNSCGAFTVTTQDNTSTPANVPGNTIVSLTGAGAGQFYSDSGCTVAVSAVTVAGGTSAVNFYFKDAVAQSLTFGATSPGLTSATLGVTVVAGAPTQLAFIGPASIGAGACISYTVQVQDVGGSPTNVSSNTVVVLQNSGAGLYYSDAGCTTTITNATVNAGTNSTAAYFKDNTAETTTLTATAAGLTVATLNVTVTPDVPTRLTLSGASPITAGACIAYTVTSRDNAGNPSVISTSSATFVALTGNGNGTFYTDNGCTVPISGGINIAASTTVATFYFQDTLPESLTFNAASPPLTPATLPVTVQPGSPTKLHLTGPSNLVTGTCAAYTVTVEDNSSNATNVLANTTVNLSGAGAGQFFSDAGCGTSTTSVVVNSGTSSRQFYFRDNTAQLVTLAADSAPLTSATINVSISAAAPTKLAVSGLGTITAAVCNSYTVQSQDSGSNPSNVGTDTTVTLSDTGAGQFYSDSGCGTPATTATITSGTNAATVYFRDNTAETTILSASAAGLTAGTLLVTVNVGAPTKVHLAGAATITASSCSLYTATIQDAGSNAINVASDTTVNLSNNGAGQFFSDGSCTSQVTSVVVTTGQNNQTFYFRDTTVETVQLTAGSVGLTAGTLTVDVQTGTPTQLQLAGPATIGTNSCSSYAVNAQDSGGTAANVASNTTVNLTGAGTGAFYSDSGCTTAVSSVTLFTGTNTRTFYLRVPTTQSLTLAASATGLTGANLSVTVQAGAPSKLAWLGPTSIGAASCINYTVQVQDIGGSPAAVGSDTTVNVTNTGAGQFFSDSGCATVVTSGTVTSGQSGMTIYFRDNSSETTTITASSTGLTSANLPVTVQSGAASQLVMTGPQVVTTGACVGYTVQSKDSVGNDSPISTGSSTFIALSGAGNGTFYTDSGCTSLVSGGVTMAANTSAIGFYFRDNLPESLVFGASAPPLTAASLSVVTQSGTPTQVGMTGPTNLVTGTCVSYQIALLDGNGNATPAPADTTINFGGNGNGFFYSDSGCSTTTTSFQILTGNSTRFVYFKDTLAETLVLTASSTGLTPASLSVNVGAGVPTKLVWSGSTTITAGGCTAYTITGQDGSNNPSNFPLNTVVSLSSTNSGQFFSDSGCGVNAPSVTIPSGTNSIQVYFKDNIAESVIFTAAATGYTSGTLNVTVQVGAAAKLVLSGSPTLTSNVCGLYTVTTQDTAGNVTNVSSNTTVNISSTGSGVLYSDATCTTVASTVPINAGGNNVNFYLQHPAVENITLSATATGLSGATLNVSVQSGSAAKLSLAGPGTLGMGACGSYSVNALDASNNPATVGSNTTVTLSGNGNGLFYSDSGCTTAISQVTILAGVGTQGFFFRDTVAESLTLDAAATGLTSAQLAVTIQAGTPQKLSLQGPGTIAAASCISYGIVSQDTNNNPANVAANVTVNLANTGSGVFYSDGACSTSATTATITAGTSSVNVFFRDNTAETTTLQATATGLTGSNLTVVVQAGLATQLALSGTSPITAGSCISYTVMSKDSVGNNTPASTSAATFIALTGNGAGQFYADGGCVTPLSGGINLPANTSQIQFFFRDTTPESLTFVANSPPLSQASLPVDVISGTPTKLAIGGPGGLLTAICAGYQVTLQDTNGNATNALSNVSVTLAGNGNGAFYSDSGCSTSTSSVTITSGTNNALFYFRDNTAESLTFSATSPPLTGATLSVNVGAAVATQLAIFGSNNIVASQCATYTITAQDANGNSSPLSSSTTVNLSNTGAGVFFSDPGCGASITSTAIASGTASIDVYFKDNTAQTTTLTAAASGLASGNLFVTVQGGAVSKLNLTGPTTLTAANCGSYTITTQDTAGNPVTVGANTTVNLTNDGAGIFYSDASCSAQVSSVTVNSGTSSQGFYFKDLNIQTVQLTASSSGLTPGILTVVIQSGTPTKLSLAGPSLLGTNACGSFTVSTLDNTNTPANVGSNTTVTLSGAGAGQFYSDAGCSTAVSQVIIGTGNGSAAFYLKDATAESLTLAAASAGLTSANLSVTIQAGAPSKLVFNGPTTIVTASCISYGVQAQDLNGNVTNVAADTTVGLTSTGAGQFFSDAACGSTTTTVIISNGTSSANVFYKDNSAELVTLTSTVPGLTSGTLNVTVTPGAATQLVLTGLTSITAGSCVSYTVTSKDSVGNDTPISNSSATPIAVTGNGSGDFYTDGGCTVSAGNVVSMAAATSSRGFFFKGPVPQNLVFNASVPPLTDATLNVSVQSGVPTQLSMSGPNTLLTGTCASYSITLRDNNGNAANAPSNTTITLSGESAGGFFSDSGCSTATGSALITSGTTNTTVYFRDNTVEFVTLAADSAGLTGATIAVNIGASAPTKLVLTGTTPITAAACVAYTVTAQDAGNNPSPVAGNTVVNMTNSGSGLFYSDSGCGSSTSSITINAGTSNRTVYFRDNTAETTQLTASATGLTAGTLLVQVQGGLPSKLAITGATTLTASACALYTVTTQDTAGNTVNVASTTTINLSNTGTGQFFSDATCTTGVSTVDIGPGTSSQTYYFKNLNVQFLTMTAAATGLTSGTLDITIQSGNPTQLSLSGPSNLGTNSCGTYTVATLDSSSSAANVTVNTTISLTGAGAGFFYSDAGCTTAVSSVTILANGNNQTFYLKDATAESLTLQAASAGLTSANLAVTIQAGVPTKLAVTGPTAIVTASCISYTVQSQDLNGNGANVGANTVINMTNSGSGQFFSDASCGTAATTVTINGGANSAQIFFRDNTAESTTLQAAVAGLTSGTLLVQVQPGAATQLTLAGLSSITAGSCVTYTVTSRDTVGNTAVISTSSPTFIALSGAGSGFFYTDGGCTVQASGGVNIAANTDTATFFYKNTVPQALTFTASSPPLSQGSLGVTVSSGSPVALALSGPGSLVSGTCATYQVGLLDNNNNASNALSDTTVSLSGAGNGAFYSDAGCSTAASSVIITTGNAAQAFYFRDNSAETVLFAASSVGLAGANLSVTVGASAPSKLVISGPTSVTAAACSPYTLITHDAANNPSNVASNTTVTLSNTGSGQFFSDPGCGAGTTTAIVAAGTSSIGVYFKDTTAESTQLSAASAGLTTGTLVVTVNGGVPTNLALTGAATLTAGNCGLYTVTSKDNSGNTVNVATSTTVNLSNSGAGIFYSDSGCTSPASSVAIAAGASSEPLYFKDLNPEVTLLTAGAATLTAGTLSVTVQSGNPTKLALSGPSTIATNFCGSFTVGTLDASNNPSNVTSNTDVNFTGAGNGAFYSDAGCTTATSLVTIFANQNSAIIYMKDTVAESLTLSSSSTGYTGASLAVNVQAGAPSKVAINGPTTITAANCINYTAQIQDLNGNAANVGANTTVTLSNTGAGVFYSDAACATSTTSAVVTSGGNTTSFYFRDNTAQSTTLQAQVTGLTAGNLNVTVNAGAATQLVLNGSSSVTAGSCASYSVTSLDVVGNPTPASTSSNTFIALNGAGAGSFYTDAGCTTTVSGGVDIAANTTTRNFYFRSLVPQSLTFDASSPPLTAATLPVTVISGSPTQLALGGPNNVLTGVCASYQVTLQDGNGNPSNAASNTTVGLTGEGAGSFYSDSGCSTSVAAVQVASGTHTTTFYFLDNTAQSLTFNATSTGLTGASLSVTVGASAPTKLVMSGALTITASACSQYTITAQDAGSNASPVASNTTVNLSNNGSGLFYSDAACGAFITSTTIAAATSSQTIYFRDNTAESITLTSSATGLTSGTLNITVQGGAASKLTLSGALTVTAGACALYNVTSKDPAGNTVNVAANTTVNLSNNGTGVFYSDSICTSSATSVAIAAGTSSQSLYFKDLNPESITLTAAASGLTSGTLDITVQSGNPTKLSLTGPATLGTNSCGSYSVTTQDASSNPAAVISNLTVNLSGAGAGQFYSDPGCTTAISSVVVPANNDTMGFYLKDPVSQTLTLGAAATGLTNALLSVQIQSGAPAKLAINGPATITTASCIAYTALVQDLIGNSANVTSNTTLNLTSFGSGQFFSDAACGTSVTSVVATTGSSSQVFYYRNNTAQSASIQVGATGLTSGSLNITVQPGAATQLALSGLNSITAGSCISYTVTSKDVVGNDAVISTSSATFISLTGAGAGGFYTDSGCIVPASGGVNIAAGTVSQTFYFKDNVPENVLFTASAPPLTDAQHSVTVQSGAPTQLALSGPSSLLTGTCASYQVGLRDNNGNAANAAANVSVTVDGNGAGFFYSDSGCSTAPITTVTINSGTNGSTYYFRDNSAESLTFGAQATGLTSASLSVNVGASTPTKLVLTGSNSITASACSPYTITAQDAGSNTATVPSNTSVTLSAGASSGLFYSDPGCGTGIGSTTISAGTSSRTIYFRDNTAESVTLGASATGLTAASLNITVQGGLPSQLAISGATVLTAANCGLFTVTAKDSAGNTVNVGGGATVNLSNTGAGTFYIDSTCTTATGSVPIVAGTSSQNFYFRDLNPESLTLTAAATGLTSGNFNLTVQAGNPTQLALSGPSTLGTNTCGTYTVTAQDASNNAAAVTSNTTVTMSGQGAGFFYSDSGCTTATSSFLIPSNGSSVAVYFKDTVSQSLTLSAAATGLTTGNLAVTVQAGGIL